MAYGAKTWCTIFITIILIFNMKQLVLSEPQVPCFFIFGDSIFDNGNNNQLITMAKANYPPYGIDFPDGATGRFSNGRNVVDFIADYLGFDNYIPPFATAKGQEIIGGVNYASGAAGIRDETGLQQGQVLSFNKQLQNHQITILRLAVLLGGKNAATEYLNKCLYMVGMGNNDYLNNYLLPQYYPSSHFYSTDEYASVVTQQYSQQLKTLYNLGARKIAIYSLGALGYVPMYSSSGIANMEYINNAVQLFNDKLVPILDEFNKNLTDAKFIYLNQSSITTGDPSIVGITVLDAPCCEVLKTSAKGQCVPGKVPCSNRTQNYFWDNFHPTEISNQLTASRSYNALLPTDAYPFDISHLVQQFNSTINQVFNIIDSESSQSI